MSSTCDVRAIIARVIECRKSDLSDDAMMGRFPKWDSFAHVEIIIELEKLLEIEIDDSTVEKLTTLRALEEFCSDHANRN